MRMAGLSRGAGTKSRRLVRLVDSTFGKQNKLRTCQPQTGPHSSHLGRQAFDPKLGKHGDGEDYSRHQDPVFGLKKPVVVETDFALHCRQNDPYAPEAARVNAAMFAGNKA